MVHNAIGQVNTTQTSFSLSTKAFIIITLLSLSVYRGKENYLKLFEESRVETAIIYKLFQGCQYPSPDVINKINWKLISLFYLIYLIL